LIGEEQRKRDLTAAELDGSCRVAGVVEGELDGAVWTRMPGKSTLGRPLAALAHTMARLTETPRPEAGIAQSTSGIACSSPPLISYTPHARCLPQCPLLATRFAYSNGPILAISLAGYKSGPKSRSSSLPFHDIPAALDLGDGMSPEPIKPATGRRTVCDHCRRRRTSDPNPSLCLKRVPARRYYVLVSSNCPHISFKA
jgi:hypothetical protein